MSSIHHLAREEVSSIVNNESTERSLSPIEDNSQTNGKTFGNSIEAIHIFPDESVVMASDTLHGLQLNGYVTKYERLQDVPNLPVLSLNPSYGGICDLIAMRDRKLICGFDSGHISLLKADLEEEMSVIYHDNQINRLNCNRLQTKTVSCGYDSSILVLDLQTFMPSKCFNYAHSAIIWDIEFNQLDDNLLVSCSRDKDVLVWDLRKAKPASKVVTLMTEPSALRWSAKDISNVYIGSNSGQLLLFDIRSPGQEITATNSTSNRIHRITNVFNGNGIAVCADDHVFKVFDYELLNCVYEDKTSHSDWVRHVCQHNQLVYTVGRDTRLVCHSELNILS